VYAGEPMGGGAGGCIHGAFTLLSREALSFAAASLVGCMSRLSRPGGLWPGRESYYWGDGFMGACIRLAAGWANYPFGSRNDSDYSRAPGMRPQLFPARLIADVRNGSLLVALFAAANPWADVVRAKRPQKVMSRRGRNEPEARQVMHSLARCRRGEGSGCKQIAHDLWSTVSVHKLGPVEMVSIHALLHEAPPAQRTATFGRAGCLTQQLSMTMFRCGAAAPAPPTRRANARALDSCGNEGVRNANRGQRSSCMSSRTLYSLKARHAQLRASRRDRVGRSALEVAPAAGRAGGQIGVGAQPPLNRVEKNCSCYEKGSYLLRRH